MSSGALPLSTISRRWCSSTAADTKAAQIFTLAHELAHIWLGLSAVSDADLEARSANATERWCNEVAAEFLLPLAALRGFTLDLEPLIDQLQALAREFKVSTLVALRRLYDAGHLTQSQFRMDYAEERDRVLALYGVAGPRWGQLLTTRSH